MKTRRLLLALLSVFLMPLAQAQEFWFPNSPKNENTTIVRPGRLGIGIPTSNFNAFNTSTGRYTVANRVGFLVEGSNFTDVSNIGHLLTGDYGEEKVGDVWTSMGGPGSPGISGLPLYGTRHQFDRYSLNMALVDRNIITGAGGTSGIRDATLFWDASPSSNSRMYIGKTLGSGLISPDIVIDPNGNVGIGTDEPTTKFVVEGTSTSNISPLFDILDKRIVNSPFEPNFSFTISSNTFGSDQAFLFFGQRTLLASQRRSIIAGGEDGIELGYVSGPNDDYFGRLSIRDNLVRVSQDFEVVGRFDADSYVSSISPFSSGLDIGSASSNWDDVFADNFINVSDKREKEKIEELTYGLDHLMKLEPVSYRMKDNPEKGIKHGLIAQDVKEVIPEVVYDPEKDIEYDENGEALALDPEARMGIAYSELIPLLIKSIQELNGKVEEQEKLIAQLTDRKADNTRTGDASEPALDQESVFELYQNAPNPFNQSTAIRYYLPEDIQKAQLFLYDVNGLQVKALKISQRGKGEVNILGSELSAGIYFYTLFADGRVSQTRKMILTDR
ncbi:MAG: tail fiber domain-containing protein [Bacteroidota bacterium]